MMQPFDLLKTLLLAHILSLTLGAISIYLSIQKTILALSDIPLPLSQNIPAYIHAILTTFTVLYLLVLTFTLLKTGRITQAQREAIVMIDLILAIALTATLSFFTTSNDALILAQAMQDSIKASSVNNATLVGQIASGIDYITYTRIGVLVFGTVGVSLFVPVVGFVLRVKQRNKGTIKKTVIDLGSAEF